MACIQGLISAVLRDMLLWLKFSSLELKLLNCCRRWSERSGDLLNFGGVFFRDGSGVSEGEYNTMPTAEIEAINWQGMFKLINTCLKLWVHDILNLSFCSCYQDYCWGLGLSNSCDVHRRGQTVICFFHWSIDTDEYDLIIICLDITVKDDVMCRTSS